MEYFPKLKLTDMMHKMKDLIALALIGAAIGWGLVELVFSGYFTDI